MKRCRIVLGTLAVLLAGLLVEAVPVAAAQMKTVYNSPYVSFSPDGQAWTTNAGDRNIRWYKKGETVSTGIAFAQREPEEGEHYYYGQVEGSVAVGCWMVEHEQGQCIHKEYPSDYHGISYRQQICEANHYSGWVAYCADCGEAVSNILVYMSREAAETIDYIPIGIDYYSLCPFCNNLEQGRMFKHTCKMVSANMYRVIYDANFPKDAANSCGYMTYSLHMYGDAEEYEGIPMTPVRVLSQNEYSCIGYRFAGWNRMPDGTGDAYEDGARIWNLTSKNWNGRLGRNEEGTVILYAQWEPVESILQIDPNGGVYEGRSDITEIKKQYGDTYTPDAALVEPPVGYAVTFQVNGGTAIRPVEAVMKFREWAMEQPCSGFFKNGIYTYIAPEGSRDTLRAVYEMGSVVLPRAEREGYSFGGWYYDSEFRFPAGGEGDSITPARNLILYAQWVNLELKAVNNYLAYGGSGAVDLSWQMQDGQGKTYLLYQSTDGEKWVKISAADDICEETDVHVEVKKTGRKENYTVPQTGIYTVILSGAQGGSYKSSEGGKGGSVELKVWLEKGEVLTFEVGGSDGYNGGGSGSKYGNGGGCTVLSSDKKGVIAVAGGGGGASESGDGGDGGSSAFLTETEYAGENGMAGGGGGFRGGTAGEYILHTHKPACYEDVSGTVTAGSYFYSAHTPWYSEVYAVSASSSGMSAYTRGHSNNNSPVVRLKVGNESTYLETPHAGTLTFRDMNPSYEKDVWGIGADGAATTVTVFFIHEDGRVTSETVVPERLGHAVTAGTEVWYRNGSYKAERPVYNKIFSKKQFSGMITTSPFATCEYPIGTYQGIDPTYELTGTFGFEVEEDVKGVYIEVSRSTSTWGDGCWMSIGVQNVSYQYSSRILKCGYEEGQVESAKSAYGGSSYVNPEAVLDSISIPGQWEGDGRAVLDCVLLGFQEELEMKNVKATDLAAPCAVSLNSVEKTPAEDGVVSVSWGKPEDNGTTYYHKAEAYLKGETSLLCTSNFTQNTLVSGVVGYYYVIDGEETSAADKSGSYSVTGNAEVSLANGTRYLHLAAVDAAGNISETIHVRIDAGSVPWNVATRQLQIRAGENVHAADEKTYYVKCDGVTPFLLEHGSYMDGPVTKENRLAYSIFESPMYGQSIIYTPSGEKQEDLIYSTKGALPLMRYPYSVTRYSDGGRSLDAEQMFTLGMEAHGQRLEVVPRAGAIFKEKGVQKTYYSELTSDESNGIVLVGDGIAPVISGMDVLSDSQLIDRQEETVRLHLTVTDDLSGVAEFYLKVTNRDNYSTKIFYPEGNIIEQNITEAEPLFTGEFTVTAYAKDNVGNVTEVSRTVTEFALETRIERILAPHDPVFKCGESGILYITTYGYAYRVEVEFPPELAAVDERLKEVAFDYSDMQLYRQESAIQFMVPLYTPADREYVIKVRAFKGDKMLESCPTFYITSEGGDVLSEFRTRLR